MCNCKANPVQERNDHLVIHFPNGYGVSIVCRVQVFNGIVYDTYGGRYGRMEMAVLKRRTVKGKDDWPLCYDTPVTSDVLGHLDEEELTAAIQQVMDLPAATEE